MRHYKRKTNKGLVPETTIRVALHNILVNKNSLNSVAEKFHIPKTTLHRYVKKIGGGDVENLQTGYSKRLQIFSSEQEASLEKYIKFAADIYFGLSPHEIKTLAYECAISYGIHVPDSWHRDKFAGPDWFSGFMRRHPSLSSRVPEATSLSRSTSFNKRNVGEFYNKLAEVLDRYKIKSHQIYNVDETGITTVQKPRNIIATKGTKQVGAMISGERGTLVTTCLAVSATGNMIPPMLIFPRKNFKNHFIRDGPTGCIGAANTSGWMTGEHFLEFLKHFVEHVRPSVDNPVLLLLDNHQSHVHVPALNYAKENGIVMLSFPPHCSHKLQPLDRSVYGPLKRYVHGEQDRWMRNNPGVPMTIYDIPSILREALPKATTPLNITRGFEITGVAPFNPDVFTEFDFAPSYVTDRPYIEQQQKDEPEKSDVDAEKRVADSDMSREQKNADAEEPSITETSNTAGSKKDNETQTGWGLVQKHLENENLALEDVPGDGHCLMYAVKTSLKKSHSYDISIEEMSERLTEEMTNYSHFYNKFAVDGQNVEKEIERYISLKEYGNNTGDLVLSALNSALELKTTLIQTDGNEVTSVEIGPGRSGVTPTKSIMLAYHREHYQAVLCKPEVHAANKDTEDHADDPNTITKNDKGAHGHKDKVVELENEEQTTTSAAYQNKTDMNNEKSKVEIKRVFAPELVRPFPKAGERKQTKQGSRKRKTAILTDTPEKAIFEFEQMASRKKENKKATARGRKKQSGTTADLNIKNRKKDGPDAASREKKRKKASCKQLCDSESDTTEEEVCCLMCMEPYSNSRSREPWLQCVVCKDWAHEECVGSSSVFVCINCDSDDSDYVH